MTRTLSLARFAVCAVVLTAAVTLNAQITITFNGPHDAPSSFTGINAWGEVSGSYHDANGTHGFVRKLDDRFITFDVPDSTGTFPSAIGLLGDVTGSTDGPTFTDGVFSEPTRGFVRHRDGTIDLFNACLDANSAGEPSEAWASPSAINDRGSIIGDCHEYIYNDPYDYGFLRKRGGTVVTIPQDIYNLYGTGYTEALAINSRNQVAGSYLEYVPTHGFITPPGAASLTTFDAVPDAYITRPTAINTQGDVAGVYTADSSGSPNPNHGFVRNSDGTIVTFDVPNALATNPMSISEQGMSVGNYTDAAGAHGFLRRIDGTIETFDVHIPNAQDITFIAVSSTNLMLGSYKDKNGGVHGFIFVPLWFLLER